MTLDTAANELEQILDRISAQLDDAQRLQIREELNAFKRSLPWDPMFAELRRLAQESFDDLGAALNAAVLKRLRERERELTKHVETLTSITDRANRNADQLRLKHIQMVTRAADEVAKAVKSVQTAIQSNDLPTAAAQTEQALALVQRLVAEFTQQA
jgi:hypothetical protein